MSKLSHLLQLITMLQHKDAATASELANILQVNKKTVYRYIDAIKSAKIPVEAKKGRYGGFYIDRDFYMKDPKLDREELQALLMTSNILTKDNGFEYEDKLRSAVRKIKDVCISQNKELKILDEDIGFKIANVGSLESFDDKISKMNYSMNMGKVLKMDYYSINKNFTTEMNISPYSIFYKEGIWYLAGYCNVKKEEVILDISRIKNIQITKDIFIKPKNFDLENSLSKCVYVFNGEKIFVKLKFHNSIAEFIKENQWNHNQVIEVLQDGSLILNIYVNDLGEVKKWILGFGELVEVLEPKSLREEISSEIVRLVEKYKKDIKE